MLADDWQPTVAPRRPLVTLKDLIWLLGYYPLLWVGRAFPDWGFRMLETVTESLYQVWHTRKRREVARIMSRRLGISLEQAALAGRRYIRNGVRRTFFDLRVLCGKDPASAPNLTIAGREHLDRELATGSGVILISIHNVANGPAKAVLRRRGYPALSVRSFRLPAGYGRLWSRWALPAYRRILEATAPDRVSPEDPECVMSITRRLRENGIVHITPDAQGAKTSATAPFLNGERRLSFGVLDVARLNRCRLLPLWAFYEGARLRIEIRPPLEVRSDVPPREHIQANQGLLAAEIESQVLAHPDQWEGWSWPGL